MKKVLFIILTALAVIIFQSCGKSPEEEYYESVKYDPASSSIKGLAGVKFGQRSRSRIIPVKESERIAVNDNSEFSQVTAYYTPISRQLYTIEAELDFRHVKHVMNMISEKYGTRFNRLISSSDFNVYNQYSTSWYREDKYETKIDGVTIYVTATRSIHAKTDDYWAPRAREILSQKGFDYVFDQLQNRKEDWQHGYYFEKCSEYAYLYYTRDSLAELAHQERQKVEVKEKEADKEKARIKHEKEMQSF